MKISRKYLAQLRMATQPDVVAFMPSGEGYHKRRLSLQRQSKTLTKHQIVQAVHSRSTSVDVVQLAQAIHLKKNPSDSLVRKRKVQFGRKLRKELSEVEIQCVLGGPMMISGVPEEIVQAIPKVMANQHHLELLRSLHQALLEFQNDRAMHRTEKLALSYCRELGVLSLNKAVQHLPVLIKKQLNNLLNLQKCYVIVLLEVCLHQQLHRFYRLLADAVGRILEQYRRMDEEVGRWQQSLDNPQYVSLRSKYKMKTPGLIIKAENYKLFQGFRKVANSLEIGETIHRLMSGLESALPEEFWYMLREYYAYHLCLLTLGKPTIKASYWEMATCPDPYLPKYDGYTLVLDLDETLAFFSPLTNTVSVRPYANEFLEQMSAMYQIVLFTAGMPDYANYLIGHLRQRESITHKLYRYHTSRLDPQRTIKDLSRLGRPLDKTLLVDNLPVNFVKQPHNGIEIRSWYGDKEDTELMKISQHLLSLYQKQCDVREYIREHFPTK